MSNASTYLLEHVMRDLESLTDDVPTRASIWLCIESAETLSDRVNSKLWRQIRLTRYRHDKTQNLWTAFWKACPDNENPVRPTQAELIAGLNLAASEHRHPSHNSKGASA